MASGTALGRQMEATTPSETLVSGPRGGPILKGGVNPSPPPRPVRDSGQASARWPQSPGQKGLGFQGLSGVVFWVSPGLPWPPWTGLWRAVLASFGRLCLHLASPGMPWLALASFGLA